jgi:hypothetical protein
MTMEHGEDCSVKVAVHARPLIGDEKLQGCKDCVSVVPGKPQVQIGTHSFTFDHVYGSSGTPSAAMFDECVAPLVEGLFQGYNATVLAYGQVNHAYPIHSFSQSVTLLITCFERGVIRRCWKWICPFYGQEFLKNEKIIEDLDRAVEPR